jgi:hypothetical protein
MSQHERDRNDHLPMSAKNKVEQADGAADDGPPQKESGRGKGNSDEAEK